MKKSRLKNQILAGLLCATLVFQNVSITAFATEDKSQETESQVQTENSQTESEEKDVINVTEVENEVQKTEDSVSTDDMETEVATEKESEQITETEIEQETGEVTETEENVLESNKYADELPEYAFIEYDSEVKGCTTYNKAEYYLYNDKCHEAKDDNYFKYVIEDNKIIEQYYSDNKCEKEVDNYKNVGECDKCEDYEYDGQYQYSNKHICGSISTFILLALTFLFILL